MLAIEGWERANNILSSEIPSPKIPTNRMNKDKWKTVGDKRANANKKPLVLLFKPASPILYMYQNVIITRDKSKAKSIGIFIQIILINNLFKIKFKIHSYINLDN